MTILDQYGKELKNQISKISFIKKIGFGYLLLKDQKVFLERFDKLYRKSLTKEFLPLVEIVLHYAGNENSVELDKTIKKSYSLTPDTEEYGETEGTIAQNAFLSLVYSLEFIKKHDDDDLWQSIEKKLESIDSINMDSDSPEEDHIIFTKELVHLQDLASQVESIKDDNSDFFCNAIRRLAP